MSTRNLSVDGTTEYDELDNHGTQAPFYVFDADAQDWVSRPHETKEAAEAAIQALLTA